MASATIKAMRLILYTLGFVSMFLVLFMAQRLEQRFQSLEQRLLEVRDIDRVSAQYKQYVCPITSSS
jgi:hypothetical protein